MIEKMKGLCFFLFFGIIACNNKEKNAGQANRFDKGTIYISCDESFKPVIDEEVRVYEGLYPETKIVVQYKPEAQCLKDIFVDSVKMVIATRGYSEVEKKWIADSIHVGVDNLVIARDLIAVIVHPSNKDSFFSMKEIKNLLTGNSKENLIPVLDGTTATSTVRFMLDSVLKGKRLGSNVMAAQNSTGVIDYVSKTPNAVGFVGFSWIGNEDDTSQLSYRKKVRMAYVESTDSAGGYVLPSQYFIYTKSYPMVRDLVYTLKEKNIGLAHAFAHFLYTMQGQLIFRRAYLMPVILPNYLRDAEMRNTINR